MFLSEKVGLFAQFLTKHVNVNKIEYKMLAKNFALNFVSQF